MCYTISVKTGNKALTDRFDARFDDPQYILNDGELSGFAFPATPVIVDRAPRIIATNYHWGLVPHWSKDDGIRKQTLNARLESIEDKPAFRDASSQRCLVPATAFYEWRWLDGKGRQKQKYAICESGIDIFAMAGIYSRWLHPQTGAELHTFAIVTTEASPPMAYIHNAKKRMPVVLRPEDEHRWLGGEPLERFGYPQYEAPLLAFEV